MIFLTVTIEHPYKKKHQIPSCSQYFYFIVYRHKFCPFTITTKKIYNVVGKFSFSILIFHVRLCAIVLQSHLYLFLQFKAGAE